MTDSVNRNEASTQTALPKTDLSFSLLTKPRSFDSKMTNQNPNSVPNINQPVTLEEHLKRNDQRLQSQMTALHKIDERIKKSYDEKTSQPTTPTTCSKDSSELTVQDRCSIDYNSFNTDDTEHSSKNISRSVYSFYPEWKGNVEMETNEAPIKTVFIQNNTKKDESIFESKILKFYS